jgi:hypothetical protein
MVAPLKDPVWACSLRRSLVHWGMTGPEPVIVHCPCWYSRAAAAVLTQEDPCVGVLLRLWCDPPEYPPSGGPLRWYRRALHKRTTAKALSAADAFITPTSDVADRLMREDHLTREVPRIVMGWCMETERFAFVPEERQDRRRELG